MPWKWYDSKVIRIEEETPQTRRLWVEIIGEEAFNFEAGQFVTMDLPISDKRLKRWRSYSIANAPDGSRILEFCIVKLDGGAASEYLFQEVEIGTVIRFKGPSGTFVLPKNLEHESVMICTGTGVAPFRSMIMDLQNRNIQHPPIHLIFGTRKENGILYRQELEHLAASNPNFKYSIALSREPGWNSYQGYVHQVYQKYYADVKPDIHFYLCGWSNMIDDAVAKLIVEMGYDKKQIHYELYG